MKFLVLFGLIWSSFSFASEVKLFKEDGSGVSVFGNESYVGDEINNKSTSLFVPRRVSSRGV
ncbi:hypothetical protein BCT49_00305 [Vibrio lentus]|uniref:Uncharacterized protein n=1 Tax=Vibrio lentus TaxID=136468 RepID=A0A2N7KAR2_9VIBR|nr:hypothetical protein BCT49_00305 [Vibrio lentus]